jgi:hypothetical protein
MPQRTTTNHHTQEVEKQYALKWLKRAENNGHEKAKGALRYLQENPAPLPPPPRDDGESHFVVHTVAPHPISLNHHSSTA